MNEQIKAPGFVSFISSPAGRILRIVVGAALIIFGINAATATGNIVAALGLIPLLAGALDVCVLGRIFGGFYRGDDMRRALHRQQNRPDLGAKSSSFTMA